MSRPSTDELTRAIELANLDDVKRLMAEGANPYKANSNGQSALEVWQDSQKKGNPYAGQMGLALLERAPASLAEASHLYQIRDAQLANLGQALGVLEYGRQVGLDYHAAYIPPQTLESSQACWAVVYQALDTFDDSTPTVLPSDFAWHFAAGLAKGFQHLEKIPGTGLANFKGTGNEPVNPNPIEAERLGNMINQAFGHGRISITPRGALASADGRGKEFYLSLAGLRSPEGHAAAIFHSDGFELDMLAGMPAKVWFGRSPEARLDEALANKDWARAQTLVQKGADINRLPLDRSLERLIESPSAKDTQALLDMGLNPLLPVSTFRSMNPTLPIHQAQSQEQFDVLLQRMKDLNPNLPVFEPESMRTRNFWENSPHFVDTRSNSTKMVDWASDKVVELAKLTVDTIGNWRKERQAASTAEQEPSRNQGPKL